MTKYEPPMYTQDEVLTEEVTPGEVWDSPDKSRATAAGAGCMGACGVEALLMDVVSIGGESVQCQRGHWDVAQRGRAGQGSLHAKAWGGTRKVMSYRPLLIMSALYRKWAALRLAKLAR